MKILKKSLIFSLIMALPLFISNSSISYASPLEAPIKVVERIFTKIKIFKHTRGLSFIEQQILKTAKYKRVNGKIVAQRKIFDPCKRDALGRTNVQRMLQGLAPIGYDGKPVELHHLKQENDGIIVEMLSSEHRGNYKELHRYKRVSEINRDKFMKWKIQYWKTRAKEFKGCLGVK